MVRYGLDEHDWQALEDEVVELFTALLRVDTTNGNETAAALVVQAYLAENGIASELDGELPDRQSLVARLDGERPGRTLTMMGHLDVVPADAGEWSVPPFAGVVKDGFVWGVGSHRHEEPGGGRGGRPRPAQALGRRLLRHRQVRGHGRRGGRRVLRRAVALRAPARRAARRLLPQRGHGRPLAAGGRAQGLPPRRRREGVRAVPHPDPRPRRPRVGAREGAQRRHRPGARRHGARPRRPAGDRLGHDGALHRRARARRRRSPRVSRTQPPRAPPAPSSAGSTRSSPA